MPSGIAALSWRLSRVTVVTSLAAVWTGSVPKTIFLVHRSNKAILAVSYASGVFENEKAGCPHSRTSLAKQHSEMERTMDSMGKEQGSQCWNGKRKSPDLLKNRIELELRSSDARDWNIYGPRGTGRKVLRDPGLR
jgi:hypothetical protein